MGNLIKSNKTAQELQPKKTASIKELTGKIVAKSVTFNTNLKISNHSRNKLQALMNLGYSASQKDAIDFLFENFKNQLSNSEKKELEFQLKVLEKRDAKLKK